MPNHVTNRVTLFGKKSILLVLLLRISNEKDKTIIDFNKIIQMPPELLEVRSPCNIVSQKEYNKEIKEIEERKRTKPDDYWGFSHNLTKKMAEDYIKRFGSTDWYDWAHTNWGTKWNAYEQSMVSGVPEADDIEADSECSFMFDTAWSTPFNVLTTLSEQYPTIEIKVEYADEDCGYNCGIYTLLNGEIVGQHQPEGGSKKAMDLYFDLHEYAREDYDLVDDNYVYRDGE